MKHLPPMVALSCLFHSISFKLPAPTSKLCDDKYLQHVYSFLYHFNMRLMDILKHKLCDDKYLQHVYSFLYHFNMRLMDILKTQVV